ncbi:hypothetical protein B0H16DRAFT_1550119 [Mycena metata]|uniref:F-box domain-containing protein n=1 Tax=Mycena metata TaxID=1033252 RepID=A0AAD7ITI7_9AGAR|nr:hypothetical protein B0H16DRAFT_1550119 [Mycena metata]
MKNMLVAAEPATADSDAPVASVSERPILDPEGAIVPDARPPIYTLPFELLAEIMALALTRRPWKYGGEQSANATDVLGLCQVCSYWREVALKTARLWNTIHLPIAGWRGVRGEAPAQTEMFFERSAPLPVSVYIHPFISPTNTDEVSAMVAGMAHRWKTFEVSCQSTKTFDPSSFTRISPDSLTNLEKVELCWWDRQPSNWHGSELDVFSNAPRLRDVKIDVPLATSTIFNSMPWSQLTCLSLAYDSPRLCLDVLASCTKLVTAYVDTKQWLESESPHNSYVARSGLLAHLTELRIRSRICSTGEYLAPFLRRFRLPALKTLGLSVQLSYPVTYEYFVDWLTPALTFLLAQSPNLQCLRLVNGGWDSIYAEDMPDILRLTPNLTELLLSEVEVDDNFFEALRYAGPNTMPLVPKLDTLALFDVGEFFEEASFGEMIRSRWWSDEERLAMPTPPIVARLKYLKFWSEDYEGRTNDYVGFTRELVETMGEYRSQGLDLTDSNYF